MTAAQCEADILLDVRARAGMTQEQLGAVIGYDRSMISNMEHRRRQIPDEVLSNLQERLEDDVAAMQICAHCKRGGFFAGIVLPLELDGHYSELFCVSKVEIQQYLTSMEDFLHARREGSFADERASAELALKHLFDLVIIGLNMARSMNKEYGLYHKKIWRMVWASVQMKILKEKKRPLEAAIK